MSISKFLPSLRFLRNQLPRSEGASGKGFSFSE